MAIDSRTPNIDDDETLLGSLACRFRSVRDPQQRREIARQYSEVVRRMIKSGAWIETLGPEEELPEEYMPKEYFEYWDE